MLEKLLNELAQEKALHEVTLAMLKKEHEENEQLKIKVDALEQQCMEYAEDFGDLQHDLQTAQEDASIFEDNFEAVLKDLDMANDDLHAAKEQLKEAKSNYEYLLKKYNQVRDERDEYYKYYRLAQEILEDE